MKNEHTRTLTFTIEYDEKISNNIVLNYDQATKIIMDIVEAIQVYNDNRTQTYTKANITGIWLEPDEVDIETQNSFLEKIKDT